MTSLANSHNTPIAVVFALLSFLVALASLFLSLRKSPAPVTTPPTPTSATSTPAPASTSTADTTTAKGGDDSSDEGDGDNKSKDKDKASPLINDAYKLIHQRYNRQNYTWETFDPVKDGDGRDGVVFIVYHRHYDPSAVRPLERLVEVHSESLKDILRRSLKHVDTVFDPKPMVLPSPPSLPCLSVGELLLTAEIG